ncbi:MAG TPA: helix-turn-helix transcriptional regulator [Candidatus Binatia bacterium]|nr:helix-turn-helix transcriptional regulator [Candidatus Binatia bacterium]
MTKADTLRLQDARAAFRLLGECRDLGNEPALWHQHMFEGLSGLFGVTQATGGEGWWHTPTAPIRPVSAFGASQDPVAHALWLAYHRQHGTSTDPFFRALHGRTDRLITRTRRDLVSDAEWYRSSSFNDFRRPARIAHELTSLFRVNAGGAISVIALNRMTGERAFSGRERRLLDFFHLELGRLIGGPLVSATEPGLDGLSPRLRQTLACLLEGDSEKQVASRLGLSRPTVHQYVTALYRHFGVASRAQLLAHVLGRRRGSGRASAE